MCVFFFVEDDEYVKKPKIVTSRQTVIEVKVPREAVGAVIGTQGATIKAVSVSLRAHGHLNSRCGGGGGIFQGIK